MRSRRELVQHLSQQGYEAWDDDPHALVQVCHRPSPRAGLFRAQPMRSIALIDLLGDSPSRLLELALDAGRAVDQLITGASAGDVTGHPTLQTIASIVPKPGAKKKRHPPHQIAVVMDAADIPTWAGAVLNGSIHDHRRRCMVCAIRNENDGSLLLPTSRSPQVDAVRTWLNEALSEPE
ncbi:MAG: hypothetical protein PF961_01755 [Planctomycetota bacterium]|jgi:hypothetical protein|nr:hypothetical protein [Planctomycetota bacterium]